MSDYANALGLLTLTMSANYTQDLFGCGLRDELKHSPIAQHIAAFLLLLFFIILTNKEDFIKGKQINDWISINLIKKTILVYMSFILIARSEYSIAVVIIFLLVFVLFMSLEIENKDTQTQEQINTLTVYAVSIGAVLLIYGTAINYKHHMDELGDKFSAYDFFVGIPKCRGSEIKI